MENNLTLNEVQILTSAMAEYIEAFEKHIKKNLKANIKEDEKRSVISCVALHAKLINMETKLLEDEK